MIKDVKNIEDTYKNVFEDVVMEVIRDREYN